MREDRSGVLARGIRLLHGIGVLAAILCSSGCHATTDRASGRFAEAGEIDMSVAASSLPPQAIEEEIVPDEAQMRPPERIAEEVDAQESAAEGEEEEEEAGTQGDTGASHLDQASEFYQAALAFWQEGNIEDALEALDSAHEQIVAFDPGADPRLLQRKHDLRYLISKQVVEIYASQENAAVDGGIAVVKNEHVQRAIARFQNAERDFFLESYRRSGRYRPMIVEELRKAGLPEQLSWLPLIESGFKVTAYSRARALGLWQFIPSTGTRFGLMRNRWIDERMDPVKSTRAAIGYLTYLHSLFGDWSTALAAYNSGEGTVLRRIADQEIDYLDSFWDFYDRLPRETAEYVPRFLAVLLIVEDPAAYGFALPEPLAPLPFETIEVSQPVALRDLEQQAGLAPGTLAELNPELRLRATPPISYSLRVPPGRGADLLAWVNALPRYTLPDRSYLVHRVRRGETLSVIAKRYGISIRSLTRYNRLRNPNHLRTGQKLRIPKKGSRLPPAPTYTTVTHTVRRGDSLWRLARRYHTTIEQIKRENHLRSNRLVVGQKLEVRAATSVSRRIYLVKRGDTLSGIARKHGIALDTLLRLNGLSPSDPIYPNQRLRLP